jgi:hypothetical protein
VGGERNGEREGERRMDSEGVITERKGEREYSHKKGRENGL